MRPVSADRRACATSVYRLSNCAQTISAANNSRALRPAETARVFQRAGDLKNRVDGSRERAPIAKGDDVSAAGAADDLAAAAVVRDDDRRATKERFERYEAEHLISRRIHDDVSARQRLEAFAASQQPHARHAAGKNEAG